MQDRSLFFRLLVIIVQRVLFLLVPLLVVFFLSFGFSMNQIVEMSQYLCTIIYPIFLYFHLAHKFWVQSYLVSCKHRAISPTNNKSGNLGNYSHPGRESLQNAHGRTLRLQNRDLKICTTATRRQRLKTKSKLKRNE